MVEFLIKKMSLFLTELCDKHCSYCDIPDIDSPQHVKLDLLKQYLPIIDQSKSFWHYTITGGEPGLVEPHVWDYIFDTIQCHPIRLNSNGKFIENGYYDLYKDKIWQIGLHVDINETIEIQISDESVWYYVPVHKKNYKDFAALIQSYPHLNFSVIPYIHKNLNNVYDEYTLTIEQYMEVYNDIYDFKNVATCSKEMIELLHKFRNNKTIFRNTCKNNYIQPELDFSRGRIGRCVFSHTQNQFVSMTEGNLNQLFEGKLDFGSIDTACEVCDECFRYFDFYFNNQLSCCS